MKTIILASESPRRKELLEKTGLKFKVVASDYEEDMTLQLAPEDLAQYLSRRKAEAVAPHEPDALIIAADTFISFENLILGKPHTPEKATQMLKQLNGKTHDVITGFTILDTKTGQMHSQAVVTKVTFKKLTDTEITNYVATKEPLDKAGAYALQNLGAVIVKKIQGEFSNVMGLPLCELTESLKKFDVNVL